MTDLGRIGPSEERTSEQAIGEVQQAALDSVELRGGFFADGTPSAEAECLPMVGEAHVGATPVPSQQCGMALAGSGRVRRWESEDATGTGNLFRA